MSNVLTAWEIGRWKAHLAEKRERRESGEPPRKCVHCDDEIEDDDDSPAYLCPSCGLCCSGCIFPVNGRPGVYACQSCGAVVSAV